LLSQPTPKKPAVRPLPLFLKKVVVVVIVRNQQKNLDEKAGDEAGKKRVRRKGRINILGKGGESRGAGAITRT